MTVIIQNNKQGPRQIKLHAIEDIMKAPAFSPYKTRAIRPLGILDAGLLKMKGYEIHHSRLQQPLVDAHILASAQRRVQTVARDDIPNTHHHGIGFYIVHQGLIGTWLLVDWWTDDILLHQRLFRTSEGDPENFKAVDSSLVCCTWELAAIAHERDAWIESGSISSNNSLAIYAADLLSVDA